MGEGETSTHFKAGGGRRDRDKSKWAKGDVFVSKDGAPYLRRSSTLVLKENTKTVRGKNGHCAGTTSRCLKPREPGVPKKQNPDCGRGGPLQPLEPCSGKAG